MRREFAEAIDARDFDKAMALLEEDPSLATAPYKGIAPVYRAVKQAYDNRDNPGPGYSLDLKSHAFAVTLFEFGASVDCFADVGPKADERNPEQAISCWGRNIRWDMALKNLMRKRAPAAPPVTALPFSEAGLPQTDDSSAATMTQLSVR